MVDVQLLDQALSIDDCYAFVQDHSCGGITLFVGTIRNHNEGADVTKLEFTSYDPMALKEMEKIGHAALALHELKKVAIHHRKGALAIGDIAVIIAVSSVHRKAAFQGCEFVIDELKKHVPIWKKEFRGDGGFWINSRP